MEETVPLEGTEQCGLAPMGYHLAISAQVVPTTLLGIKAKDELLVVLQAAVPAQARRDMGSRHQEDVLLVEDLVKHSFSLRSSLSS